MIQEEFHKHVSSELNRPVQDTLPIMDEVGYIYINISNGRDENCRSSINFERMLVLCKLETAKKHLKTIEFMYHVCKVSILSYAYNKASATV